MTHITKLTEIVDGRLLPSDKKLSSSLLEVDTVRPEVGAGRLTITGDTLGFDYTGLATESYVWSCIESAQFNGGEVDLRGYATKDELTEYAKTSDIILSLNEIGESLDDQLPRKVDKIEGKELSTNDFTNSYKDQLDNMTTTVDTQIDDKFNNVYGPGLEAEFEDINDKLGAKLDHPDAIHPAAFTTPTVNSVPLYTLGNNGAYVLCTPDTWLNINGFLVPGYLPETLGGTSILQ